MNQKDMNQLQTKTIHLSMVAASSDRLMKIAIGKHVIATNLKLFGVFIISCENVTHGKITLFELRGKSVDSSELSVCLCAAQVWEQRYESYGSKLGTRKCQNAIFNNNNTDNVGYYGNGCQTYDMNNKQTPKINNNESSMMYTQMQADNGEQIFYYLIWALFYLSAMFIMWSRMRDKRVFVYVRAQERPIGFGDLVK